MKQIHTAADIARLGTILGVWAHPDDESFYMACIAATAVKQGQTVICITATHGEAGIQNSQKWPPSKLAAIRTHELQEAMKIIGIKHHYWLEYADGQCDKVRDETAAHQIAEIINRHQPDTILTFGPEGMTGHPDHQAVSAWTKLALSYSTVPASLYNTVHAEELYEPLIEVDKQCNIFFNIDKPPLLPACDCDICYEAVPSVIDLKLRALQAMESQTEVMFSDFNKHQLAQALGTETFTQISK